MIRRLIQEVHRRSLWQVLGIYLAASSRISGLVRPPAALVWSMGWLWQGRGGPMRRFECSKAPSTGMRWGPLGKWYR